MDGPRIAPQTEVEAYLGKTRTALNAGAEIIVQEDRMVDRNRPDERYTNKYTLANMFPDEDPAVAVRRELSNLNMAEYLRTVPDIKYPQRGEFWEFGRTYSQGDVYIKFRVHLLNPDAFGKHTMFVMSFHYAEKPLSEETFPYR